MKDIRETGRVRRNAPEANLLKVRKLGLKRNRVVEMTQASMA